MRNLLVGSIVALLTIDTSVAIALQTTGRSQDEQPIPKPAAETTQFGSALRAYQIAAFQCHRMGFLSEAEYYFEKTKVIETSAQYLGNEDAYDLAQSLEIQMRDSFDEDPDYVASLSQKYSMSRDRCNELLSMLKQELRDAENSMVEVVTKAASH